MTKIEIGTVTTVVAAIVAAVFFLAKLDARIATNAAELKELENKHLVEIDSRIKTNNSGIGAVNDSIDEIVNTKLVALGKRVDTNDSAIANVGGRVVELENKQAGENIPDTEKLAKTNERNFRYLGQISCRSASTIPVPDPNTITKDWFVFGVDPYINTEFDNDSIFNNALMGFKTNIESVAGDKAWKVTLGVRINLNTTGKDTGDCNRSRGGKFLTGNPSTVHLVAFRRS